MVKKIVDVPDNATTIAVLENNDAVFGALNISVSGLPDAPEKRVIDVELANWYLGHVEFVAKKEPKFKVLVELHEGDLWVTKNRTNDIDDEEISFSLFDNDHDTRGRYKFTEEEADELVAGLTALTARKVKVE